MKKKHVDDDNPLLSIGPHDKRLSMIHHMPSDESLPVEGFKVHIPGGPTEGIIIHTDCIPPTPRLSLNTEQSILMPVIDCFCFIRMMTYLFFLFFPCRLPKINHMNKNDNSL
jgi:hypothetical protein